MNGNIDVHAEYNKAVKRRAGGHEVDHDGLPSYIVAGTREAQKWHARHPDNNRSAKVNSSLTGSTAAHRAAQEGDLESLEEVLSALEDIVNKKDANGWTPLHEGARGGYLEVVQLLVEKGADINEITANGETPLYWAGKNEHGPVAKFLEGMGAIVLGPEL
jgi:ankyrin repeat protein